MDFSSLSVRAMFVNSLTIIGDGTAVRKLGGDNAISKEDKTEGSTMFNTFGDSVTTIVKLTSVSSDWLWIDAVMGASKALITLGWTALSKDGATLDIWCSKLIICEVGMLSIRVGDDAIVFNSSTKSAVGDSANTHLADK